MRILILSSSTGAGHDSCAKAVKESFDNSGTHCQVAEVLNFISSGVAGFITGSHTVIYRHFPWAFNIGYKYMEDHAAFYSKGTLVNKLLSLGGKRLYKYITDGGYDAVICTHPFATVTLAAALEGKDHNIKTAFVSTDYTCAPTIMTKGIDVYFIPDEKLIPEFEKYGIEKYKLKPSGIPVKQVFYKKVDIAEAKKQVGINPDNNHLLVMCGSMGCGPIKNIVKHIAQKNIPNTEITVITGTNKRLKSKLKRLEKVNDNLHTKGFVDNMPLYLNSADLYLTKPGGLSTSEAVSMAVPMVFINAVAGCEAHNLKHFVNLGVAVSSKNKSDAGLKCTELLNNKDGILALKTAFSSLLKVNSANYIANYFLNIKGDQNENL